MSYSVLPRGTHFVRSAIAQAIANGDHVAAHRIAAARWGEESHAARLCKAAMTDSDSANLERIEHSAELVGAVQEAAVVGKVSQRLQVPLQTRVLQQTSEAAGAFVRRGDPIPVSALSFSESTLEALQLCGIVVLTDESLRGPLAERTVRRELIRVGSELLDRTLLDPNAAGESGVSPPSITFGAPTIVSTGSVKADVAAMLDAYQGDLSTAVVVSDPVTFVRMAIADTLLLPDLGARGGSMVGLPAIASRSSPRTSNGGQLALFDGSALVVGEGLLEVRASKQASIEMRSDPTNNTNTPTAAQMVSLYQTNCAALRFTWDVNFRMSRPGAVVVLTGAAH